MIQSFPSCLTASLDFPTPFLDLLQEEECWDTNSPHREQLIPEDFWEPAAPAAGHCPVDKSGCGVGEDVPVSMRSPWSRSSSRDQRKLLHKERDTPGGSRSSTGPPFWGVVMETLGIHGKKVCWELGSQGETLLRENIPEV